MTTVTISPTPLSESDGSMGHHVETARVRSQSTGSMGVHVEVGAQPATSTVNGTTYVLPLSDREPQ